MKSELGVRLSEKVLWAVNPAFALGVELDLAVELARSHWLSDRPWDFCRRLIRTWERQRAQGGQATTDPAVLALAGIVLCPECGEQIDPGQATRVAEGVIQCPACKRLVNIPDPGRA